jgi:phosphoglycerol transferase
MNTYGSEACVRPAKSIKPGRVWRAGASVSSYVFTAVFCVLALISIYRLHRADLRIPLGNGGDAYFGAASIKNFVETGHYYVNPRLGAPGEQELYDYPGPCGTSFLALSLLRIVTRSFGLALNLYYLAGYVLAALTSLYVFRRFGISTPFAIAGSILYSFLPYHLLRGEGHLGVGLYYLVPLCVMVVLWLCTGNPLFAYETQSEGKRPLLTRDGLISLGIGALIASDNVYYAFFAGLFLILAGLLARFCFGHRRALYSASLLGSVLTLVFVLNLTPSIKYSHDHGPAPVAQRFPMETELYGLKITQLLAPVSSHRIPAMAQWKARYNSQAPLVNENDTASLGVIGSIGFLTLLACFFVPRSGTVLYSLALLNLWAVLIGTIGGFSSLFSFTLTPQFRAWNRISVFIGFFSIFAVVLLTDRLLQGKRGSRWFTMLVPLVLLGAGLADQIPRHFLPPRRDVEAGFRQEDAYIHLVEASVPPNSMIFQLPYDPFPESPPVNQMQDYDQIRGYLHSRSLRWSYGAIKGRPTDQWIASVSRKRLDQMLSEIATAGFAGIYIDRFGYVDRATQLETQLRVLLETEPIVSPDGRWSFFRMNSSRVAAIRDLMTPDKQAHMERLLSPMTVQAGTGCWPREGTEQDHWNWCDSQGELVITNPRDEIRKIIVEARLITGHQKPSELTVSGPGFSRKLMVSTAETVLRQEFSVHPGQSTVRIESKAAPVIAPGDSRHLVFQINNVRYREVD